MNHWSYADDMNIRHGNGPVFWKKVIRKLILPPALVMDFVGLNLLMSITTD